MATLPKDATKLTISSFDPALTKGIERCDLSSLRFVDAYGLVGTANAIRAATADGEQPTIIPPRSSGMKEHLAAMGFDVFLEGIGQPELGVDTETFESSGVVVPLRSASDSGGEQAISELLWGQLRDQVGPQVLGALSEGVWEMVAK